MFKIKKDKDGRFYFEIYARNNIKIAESIKYASLTATYNNILSVTNIKKENVIEDF